MNKNTGWRQRISLALMLVLMLGRMARCKRRVAVLLPPDSTGLVGTQPGEKPTLPLKFWENPRKSPLKPRRKDLDEQTLLRLMGQDFDSKWMRRSPPSQIYIQEGDSGDQGERTTVKSLREMAAELKLPDELVSAELKNALTSWLVRHATCPIRYVWDDLGPYFWPRWIRRGECVHEIGGDEKNATRSSKTGATRKTTCSWPPGMFCVPGMARNLHILRWHCRLRKNMSAGVGANSNNVWLLRGSAVQPVATDKHHNISSKTKRRKRYRCQWLKVPYPVPGDCVCSC